MLWLAAAREGLDDNHAAGAARAWLRQHARLLGFGGAVGLVRRHEDCRTKIGPLPQRENFQTQVDLLPQYPHLQIYQRVERGVSGFAAHRPDEPRRRDASCCGRLAPAANASDLSIKRDVVWMAFNAARIGLSRPLMIDRRAFEMMMRGFAREGRRGCHKHHDHDHDHDHDRDQRSHFNPHLIRRFSARPSGAR
jgi:hypothetical protein